uniref:30S ribosomal protein S2 n=1 Tax=Nephromyces sp. ex Molgula occidentalis TaxID=2544991 RepID=A0A5C1H9Q2_9APIC|nr:30S ribosomal protein S2 [Nephromyces sp. ex Molgula occidentalis]
MNFITLKKLINSKVQLGNIYLQKNFNNKNIIIYKVINNNYIIDLIQTSKYLLKTYILLYKISLYNKNIIFINTTNIIKNLLKKTAKITKQFYIIKYFKTGIFSNWNIIYNNILLLYWINNIIRLIKKNLIFKNLNIKNKKKLYYLYNKLYYKFKNFKGIIKLPNIIFLLDLEKDIIILKEITNLNKIIISIINSYNTLNFINIPIPGNNKNYYSVKLILEFITTALLQGNLKYNLLINNLN